MATVQRLQHASVPMPPGGEVEARRFYGEVFGWAAFAFEAVLGWMIVRLDYELRYYVVTDRSIRIREGAWTVREIGGASIVSQPPCTRCHAEGGVADPLEPGAVTRDAAWIEGHLLDPEMIAPGLREPPETNEREIAAVLAYLARARRGETPPALADGDVTAMRVFARFCIGCHRLEPGAADGGDEGPKLTGIGGRHGRDALRRWIADPEAVDPSTDMPAFGSRLTAFEMTSLVEWLARQR